MVRQMDEHEQRSMMLKMLQNAPDWVTSEVIEANTWMNQWGVFEAAMRLVKQGHPVCVQHLESGSARVNHRHSKRAHGESNGKRAVTGLGPYRYGARCSRGPQDIGRSGPMAGYSA